MILGFGNKQLDKIQKELKTYSNQINVVVNGLYIDMIKYKKEFSAKAKKIKSDFNDITNDNKIYINDQIKAIHKIRETIDNDTSIIKESKKEILHKVSEVESKLISFESKVNSFNAKIKDVEIAQSEFFTVFSEFKQLYQYQNKAIKNSRNMNLIFSFVNILLLITVLALLFYK